jgi:hypothetical protein
MNLTKKSRENVEKVKGTILFYLGKEICMLMIFLFEKLSEWSDSFST